MSDVTEHVVRFVCEGEVLFGITHLPRPALTRGVLIIVGGPQYRIGSHRQFVLLARELAQQGVPVMRFDGRGMGDSTGSAPHFADTAADIRAAMDAFFQQSAGLREVVLWGLCDGASAAALYAHQDSRVTGIVMVNPWVRTESGLAKTYFRHYYLQRLLSPGLWRKIAKGEFSVRAAGVSLWSNILTALGRSRAEVDGEAQRGGANVTASLPDRLLASLRQFKGEVLIILSSNDLTAAEFASLLQQPNWRALLASSRFERNELQGASHTYAKREWRDQVTKWTVNFVRQIPK